MKCTIKISNSSLEEVINKVAATALDGINFEILPKREGDEYNYMSVSSCDCAAQTLTFSVCKVARLQKPVAFIVDKALVGVVKSLASLQGEDFILEVNDATCTVKCGSSVVPVAILQDCTKLGQNDPQSADLCVNVKKEELLAAIYRGGYAFDTTGCIMPCMKNMLAFIPEVIDDEKSFRIISLNEWMKVIASKKLVVETENDEVFASFTAGKNENGEITTPRVFLLNASYLSKVLPMMEDEDTQIFFWENQITIHNLNDCYTMVPGKADGFNFQLLDVLNAGVKERNYSFTVDVKKLRAAINIALLNPSQIEKHDTHVVEIKLTGEKLSVCSYTGKNVTEIDAQNIVGDFDFAMDTDYAKRAFSHLSDSTVTIYGASPLHPIFVQDTDKSAVSIILPFKVRTEEEEDTEPTNTTDSDEDDQEVAV